ncbi:hypothetical protein [Streptomyces sp. NPDC003395]
MNTPRPVTIAPPSDHGGRLVAIHGRPVGHAYGMWDLVAFLHRAGLSEPLPDEDAIAASELIDWLGAGPDQWEP